MDHHDRARDWFRNTVSLARGAEEHAAAAEREACCAAVAEERAEQVAAAHGAIRRAAEARRYAEAARKYRGLLRALSESTGNANVERHFRDAAFHVAKADRAEACAMDAAAAMVDVLTPAAADPAPDRPRPLVHTVCPMGPGR